MWGDSTAKSAKILAAKDKCVKGFKRKDARPRLAAGGADLGAPIIKAKF
jgi:hypothetical protein